MLTLKTIKKVLVFSPHPDDADFGCAGTVAKLIEEGSEAALCVITNGNKGVHWNRFSTRQIVPVRKLEQRASAGILGIKKVIFLNEEDGALENTKKLRKKLVQIIRQEKPDIVFSFDPANRAFDRFQLFHRDHRLGAEAVFDAVYPEAGCDVFYPELSKRGSAPHTIKEMWLFGTHCPNLFIDVSSTIDKKIKALSQHKSQFGDAKKVKDRIVQRAADEGRKKRMKRAEVFRVITF